MFKRKLILSIIAIIMLSAIAVFYGCNTSPVNEGATTIIDENNNKVLGEVAMFDEEESTTEFIIGSNTIQEILLEDNYDKNNILSINLTNDDVALAKIWLEEQGYTYIDTNSLVLIEKEYNYLSDTLILLPDNQSAINKSAPGPHIEEILFRADTIVWSAFENPTHDLANHTALITYWRNGNERNTVFIELDIGTEIPSVIQEGLIIDGEFVPENIGVDSWLGCVLGGAVGSILYCLNSNCAYGHCVGGAFGITLLVCTIQWAFSL